MWRGKCLSNQDKAESMESIEPLSVLIPLIAGQKADGVRHVPQLVPGPVH